MEGLKIFLFSSIIILFNSLSSCSQHSTTGGGGDKNKIVNMQGLEVATFGAGCFWCVEVLFQELKGVEKVVSGYTGGKVKNPTYKEICSGLTEHAEVIQITYDPQVISYEELLNVLWVVHDPTTLNRQGNDVGTQYRSAVFYHNEEQRKIAEQSKKDAASLWDNPIVTEITPYTLMYDAEDYHQDYYNNNGQTNSYCRIVIAPKIVKFRKQFVDKLKK